MVSVIYNTLASILGDVNTTSGNLSSYFQLLSNSRIISSTVKPFGVSKFKRPVRIVLENNGAVSHGGSNPLSTQIGVYARDNYDVQYSCLIAFCEINGIF